MKPHHPRTRIRRMIKWGGLVACVLLLGVWVASIWFFAACLHSSGRYGAIVRGSLEVGCIDDWREFYPPVLKWRADRLSAPECDWWFYASSTAGWWRWCIPLWVPFAPLLAATILAWRADAAARRQRLINACPHCGYDRRGLPTPTTACPECGGP